MKFKLSFGTNFLINYLIKSFHCQDKKTILILINCISIAYFEIIFPLIKIIPSYDSIKKIK